MAQRRMFSQRIVGSARFLKMPPSSQALYFHLAMHADDDGIVEAFQVMKLISSNEDDIRVLASKNFIKILNEDLVTFVMDWTEHNLIRADRKVDSIYKELLLRIMPEVDIVEPKNRSDRPHLDRVGRPGDGNGTAQVSIGEVRVDISETAVSQSLQEKTPPNFEDWMDSKGYVMNDGGESSDGITISGWSREVDGRVSFLGPGALKSLRAEFKKLYGKDTSQDIFDSLTPAKQAKSTRPKAEFNYKEQLERLKASKYRGDRIISALWKMKGYSFGTIEQMNNQMQIDRKYAKMLETYTNEQIRAAAEKCVRESKELGYDWKVATVVKKINEIK